MSDSTETDESACCGGTDIPLEVYNDLLCPICLEFFKHPIILPCSHVLCRSPCAENLFDFNFIRCPVCRENCYVSGGIGSLPRVIPLESIIEKYRLERRKVIQSAKRAQKKVAQNNHVCSAHKSSNARAQDCQSNNVCVGKPPINHGSGHEDQSGSLNVNGHNVVNCNESSSNGTCSDIAPQWPQRRSRTVSGTFADSVCRSTNETYPLSPETSARSEHFQRPPIFRFSSTPRNWDRFDASLLDLSSDSVASCSRHGSETSVYCQVCEHCVCDVCGDVDHVTSHVTNSVDDAALQAKEKLINNLEKVTNSQIKVLTSLEQQKQQLKDIEQTFHRKTEETNMQFDSLLAEVEHKRSLFLADLEQEELMRRSDINAVIEILEKILASSQSLAQYTKDVLDKDNTSILQVTPALNEQLLGSVVDCEACQGHPDDLHPDPSPCKVVDLRKEQVLLRDIHYLNPPSTPSIDLGRCARGENTVALFIAPPRHSDVIDSYVIRYCSQEQKALGIEEALTLDNQHPTNWTGHYPEWTSPHHPHPHPYHHHLGESSSPSSSSSPSPVLVVLLERLHSGTPYYFSLSASNRAGDSDSSSEVVQCVTLTATHSVVPVPEILEAMCHTYPTSVRVYTPSPHDVAPEQSISHFLLYRPRDRKCLWRCLALCGRVEERVFGLEPGMQYEFAVMAKNPRGECQISNKVVLETDCATTT